MTCTGSHFMAHTPADWREWTLA